MKRVLASVLALLAVGIGVGVASATLSSTGAGTGNAATSTLSAVTLTASAGTPTSRLLPGGSGDTIFQISNPNAVAVSVVSVVANGAITVSGGTGCSTANDGVTFANQSGLSLVVPAGATNFSIDLPNSVTMSSSANNGCQGAAFSVPVIVTANQG